MPDDILDPIQRISGRRVLADALKTFMFSLSQGLGASAGARGAAGTRLGVGAALGAPFQLEELERNRQMQDEDRKARIEQARELTRRGQFDDAVKMLNAVQGSQAPEQTVNAPVATPAPIGTLGGGTYQPPTQGGGTMGVPLPLKPVNIPGYGQVQPVSAQQQAIQRANELRQQVQLGAEFRPDRFSSSPAGIFNTQTGEVATPAPSVVSPELIAAIAQNPARYHDLTPTIQAALLPELSRRQIEIPAKPVDPTLQAIRDMQLDNLSREAQAELTPRQTGIAMQLASGLKSHPAYMDMQDIDTGLYGVETGLAQENGFGDIAAINAFQRMIDPGATVREGDVALMQSASAMAAKVLTDYPIEKLRTGAKLPTQTRQAMLKVAKELHAVRSKNYNDTIGNQYKALAKASNIPFQYVGSDFGRSTEAGPKAGDIQDGYEFTGGDPAEPKNWKKR